MGSCHTLPLQGGSEDLGENPVKNWPLGECVSVCPWFTGVHGEPLQPDLDHLERFLSFVQGDRLSALLLDVQLKVVLEVAANT